MDKGGSRYLMLVDYQVGGTVTKYHVSVMADAAGNFTTMKANVYTPDDRFDPSKFPTAN